MSEAERASPRVTIVGGPAKMTKLAQGLLDLHSKRGAFDLAGLGELVAALVEAIVNANSGLHAFEIAAGACFDLPALVADGARRTAASIVAGAPSELEIVVVGRDGRVLARSGFRKV
jgi:cobalt-precorrin-5B (C1)-methyltransferase